MYFASIDSQYPWLITETLNKLKTQQTLHEYCVERSLEIGNITSLIECIARRFTGNTLYKQL